MAVTDTRTATAERFLDALARRDYEELRNCFAAEATLRAVVPPGLREDDGIDAIVARFQRWTGQIDDYRVAESEAVTFADLIRMRWVVEGTDPDLDGAPSTYEQTAYAEIDENGLITRLRIACSGDRPLA